MVIINGISLLTLQLYMNRNPEIKPILQKHDSYFYAKTYGKKTRPDSPVPSLQGPCDRSLKSEEP